MLKDVKENILIMNEKLGKLTRETENIKKNQMEIIRLKTKSSRPKTLKIHCLC
jgi:hypothetical protein